MMLFGFGKNKRSTSGSGSSSSSKEANPFRALGVPEDATYEQVEMAYNRLAKKYADDPKKVMWLEIQKDKVFDMRLQQRMAGQIPVRVKESPFERKAKKKKRFQAPEWLKGFVKLPDRPYLVRVSLVMGVFGLLGFVTPTLVGSTMAMGFIAAAGFLFNRGLPDVPRDDFGNPGEVRDVKGPVIFKTIGVTFGTAGIFFGLGQLVLLYLGLPDWCAIDSFVNFVVILGLWLSCILFQVQPDPY
eukprot:CAMPEP_0184684172 /NCGR_PEP_ID=MMETSP0312-20130426/14128_1 /TAXON_ID=31354 /ORGANISM="Compsopogon coeruleus, Strain SAG 36.94" /LENGTH=242 /DNA_ID=CAMNT_0027137085 /DNA_START=183 /DNA_END=911 /DNA_ORIENTATION=+